MTRSDERDGIGVPRLRGVDFACPKRWSDLAGVGRVRRCSSCARSVQDLSALTAAAAHEVLRREPGACIRLARDSRGVPVHRPNWSEVVGAARIRVLGVVAFLVLTAVALFFSLTSKNEFVGLLFTTF